jgi:hypothetical protein
VVRDTRVGERRKREEKREGGGGKKNNFILGFIANISVK